MADNAWDPEGFQSSGGQSVEERQQQPPQQGAGGGLMDHWNTFMDHPENRAGLMQFAVNMLAGQGLAGGLGGFAEAASGNIGAQQEAEKQEEAEAIKERETAAKEQTAEAYGRSVDKQGIDKPLDTRKIDYMANIKNKVGWMKYANDMSPSPGDATLIRMRIKHPEIKNMSKQQMLTDPNLAREAEADWHQHNDIIGQGEAASEMGGAPSGGGGFVPPPDAIPRRGKDGRIYYYKPNEGGGPPLPYPGQD